MRKARKTPIQDALLLLTLCLLGMAGRGIGQLHIGTGTSWVSTPATSVALNDMGFRHDGATGLLDNSFHFTGTKRSAIVGDAVTRGHTPLFIFFNVYGTTRYFDITGPDNIKVDAGCRLRPLGFISRDARSFVM